MSVLFNRDLLPVEGAPSIVFASARPGAQIFLVATDTDTDTDTDGWRVGLLPARRNALMAAAPEWWGPLGHTLSTERREALLDEAQTK